MNEKLLAYYLGTLNEGERLEIEEELLESKSSLMGFIALKRSFELKDGPALEPSRALKMNLMRDVSAQFEKSRFPAPFRTALAVAAALAVMLGAYSFFKSRHPATPASPVQGSQSSGVSVDSSNSAAVSLNVI
jgi:hypothetical protein